MTKADEIYFNNPKSTLIVKPNEIKPGFLCKVEPTKKIVMQEVSWTFPNMSNNGSFGGSECGLTWSTWGANWAHGPWTGFNADYDNGQYCGVYGDEHGAGCTITIYVPVLLKPTQYKFIALRKNSNNASGVFCYPVLSMNVDGSWIEIARQNGNVGLGEKRYNISTNHRSQYFRFSCQQAGHSYADELDFCAWKIYGTYQAEVETSEIDTTSIKSRKLYSAIPIINS